MAEVYTFDEAGMRAVVALVKEQCNEIKSLKRHLTHYATRRHEAVYLPAKGGVRLVTYTHLPAAYVISSTERQYYPQLCDSTWEIESDGEHSSATGERIYVANMGDLPLFSGGSGNGVALVAKAYTDPTYGEVWGVVEVLSERPFAGACYDWFSPDNVGEWDLSAPDKVLLRVAPNGGSAEEPSVSGDSRRWCFGYGGDVMLSHPGTYEVTIGARVLLSSSNPPRNTETTSDASAGTSHTHTYTVPTSITARIGVQQNFQPGVSTVGSSSLITNGELRIPLSIPGATYEAEKTFVFSTQTSPWHALKYTRLSVYFAAYDEVGWESSGSPEISLSRAWMIVRPGQRDDGAQYLETGVNQYPNGRSSPFVWYGSSSPSDEPDFIDKDGAAIP